MYAVEDFLYLILSLYFGAIWLGFYFWRPDVRKEMWFMSWVGLLLAPPIDAITMKDWWHPITLTPGPIHVDSLLFGFFSLGVTSVVAQVFSHQKTRVDRRIYVPQLLHMVAGLCGAFAIMFMPYLLWGVHSFLTTLLACLFMAGCVAFRRPDLVGQMFISAVLTAFVALPGYWMIVMFLEPLWFEKAWYLNRLSGIWVSGLPVEEIIWYLATGAVFGVLYKCKQGLRLVPVAYLSRVKAQVSSVSLTRSQ